MAKQQTTSKPPQPAAQQQSTALATQPTGGGGLAVSRISDLAGAYAFGQLVAANQSGDAERLATALKDNLGGGSVNVFDFMRIKVPAGGMEAWEVIDADTGETSYDKAVTGILTFWTDQKAFWRKGLDGKDAQKTPPDCYSVDTIRGIGDPGVACASCAFNQFGTAKDNTGKGKACKDVRHLLICRPDDALPILLPAPPTSIKPIRQYFLDLAGRAIPYWAAVTEFTLKKKSSGGNDYGTIVPRLVGVLDGPAYAASMQFNSVVRRMLGRQLLTERADVDGVSSSGGGAPDSVQVSRTGHTGRSGNAPSGAGQQGYAGDNALGDDDGDLPGSTRDDVINAEVSPAGNAS